MLVRWYLAQRRLGLVLYSAGLLIAGYGMSGALISASETAIGRF